MNATDIFKTDFSNAFPNIECGRPLICEGSPLNCTIFIVGFNPATMMENDLWAYWSDGYGFRKSEWFKQYKEERLCKKKASGRPRATVSAKRRNIDWIIEGGNGSHFLETNIYIASRL